jgi:hypothetical protein
MEGPPLPEVPGKVTIYETIKPSEENQKKQVESLASSLGFKKGRKSLSRTPGGFSIEESDHVLETYDESDSIWYSNMSRLEEETAEPLDAKKALGVKSEDEIEKEAGNRADKFLKKLNLLPKEAKRIGLKGIEVAELSADEDEVGETVVTGVQEQYKFELDDIPVVGPGAKISVDFGRDGEVVGLFKAWRKVKKDQEISTISPEEALGKFQSNEVFASLDEDSEVKVDKFFFGHYALPAFEQQDHLLPVYVFEGKVKTFDDEHPFVYFLPGVSIDELKNKGIALDMGAYPLLP